MFRTHPLYFVFAIIVAASLQYLLIRRMNRTTDAKHGEANLHKQKEPNKP